MGTDTEITNAINGYVGMFGYAPYKAKSYSRFYLSSGGWVTYIQVSDIRTGEVYTAQRVTPSDLSDPKQAANDIIFEIEHPKN